MRLRSLSVCLLLVLLLLTGSSSSDVSGLWNVLFDNDWHSGYVTPPESCRLSLSQKENHLTGYWAVEAPELWNGVVEGVSREDEFEATLTVYGQQVVVMSLTGELSEDGLLQGSFVAATSKAGAWYGTFIAALMNEDPGLFDPVEVAPSWSAETTSGVQGVTEGFTPRVQPSDRFYKIEYIRGGTIYPRPVI